MSAATTYIATSGYSFGVTADETAINVESFEVMTKPEFIDVLVDKTGHARDEARGAPEQEINVKGEWAGSTGLIAATFYVAVTLINSITYHGGAGGVYLNEATVTSERQGWKKGSWKLQRKSGIA